MLYLTVTFVVALFTWSDEFLFHFDAFKLSYVCKLTGSIEDYPLKCTLEPVTCAPPHLEPTICHSDNGVVTKFPAPVGTGGDSLHMLSVAIKISKDSNMRKLKVI